MIKFLFVWFISLLIISVYTHNLHSNYSGKKDVCMGICIKIQVLKYECLFANSISNIKALFKFFIVDTLEKSTLFNNCFMMFSIYSPFTKQVISSNLIFKNKNLIDTKKVQTLVLSKIHTNYLDTFYIEYKNAKVDIVFESGFGENFKTVSIWAQNLYGSLIGIISQLKNKNRSHIFSDIEVSSLDYFIASDKLYHTNKFYDVIISCIHMFSINPYFNDINK